MNLEGVYGDGQRSASATAVITASPRATQVPPEFYDGQDATARLTAWLNARTAGEVLAFDSTRDLLCQSEVKVTGVPDLTFQDVGLSRTDPEKLVLKNGLLVRPAGYTGAHLWLLNCLRPKFIGRYRVRSTNTVTDGGVGYGAYDAEKELAAALRLEGCHGLRITVALDVDGVWGDCVQLVKSNDFGMDFTGQCDRNGRQGVTPLGIGGWVRGFKLLHGRRGGFDLEPFSATRMCGDIEISGYDVFTRLQPFPSQGKGPVDNVWIHDGKSSGLAVPAFTVAASDGARRSNWRIERHTSVWTLASSQAAVKAVNVDGLVVKDSRFPVSSDANRSHLALELTGCGDVTVTGTDFGPGGTLLRNTTPAAGQTLTVTGNTPALQVV